MRAPFTQGQLLLLDQVLVRHQEVDQVSLLEGEGPRRRLGGLVAAEGSSRLLLNYGRDHLNSRRIHRGDWVGVHLHLLL